MTQPTFSQYLNCVIPLNTDTIFKLADLLQVSPFEIDPKLKDVHSLKVHREARLERVRIPYIGSISGRTIMGHAALLAENLPAEGIYTGIAVDNNSLVEAGIPKGSTIVLDVDADPYVKHRHVALRIRGEDGFHYMQYQDSTDSSVRLKDPKDGKIRTYRLNQIAQMHLVYSVTTPS